MTAMLAPRATRVMPKVYALEQPLSPMERHAFLATHVSRVLHAVLAFVQTWLSQPMEHRAMMAIPAPKVMCAQEEALVLAQSLPHVALAILLFSVRVAYAFVPITSGNLVPLPFRVQAVAFIQRADK